MGEISKAKQFHREVTLNHSYFKTQTHFIHYVYKYVHENKLNHNLFTEDNIKVVAWVLSQLPLFKSYGLNIPIDKFTWEIKHSKSTDSLSVCDLLYECFEEFSGLKMKRILIKRCININKNFLELDEKELFQGVLTTYEYTKEFFDIIRELYKSPGVYFLYNIQKKLMYIGQSSSLLERVQSSIRERKCFYCKILKTDCFADSIVLETYYIALINPELNVQYKRLEKPTFRIKHKYRFTKLTKIFDYEW